MSFIQFQTDSATEVLLLSKEGIWANPDIPVDEAAKLVLAAIDGHIKAMVEKAVAAEREACAKVVEEYETNNDITATWLNIVADAIRARGETK